MIETGETPLQAAQRELREELGRISKNWTHLGKFVNDVNRGMGWIHCFLARGAHPGANTSGDDDLEQRLIVRLNQHQLKKHVLSGDFQESKWSLTILLAIQSIETPQK